MVTGIQTPIISQDGITIRITPSSICNVQNVVNICSTTWTDIVVILGGIVSGITDYGAITAKPGQKNYIKNSDNIILD